VQLLVLTELFLPTKGGTAVWAAEVYPRLGGKEVHILTAEVPGAAAIDAVHPNTIHRLDFGRVRWLRPESLLVYVRLLVRSLRLAIQHHPKGIHALRALPEGLVALAVGRLTLRPVVIYAHGEELTTWGRGAKYRAMRFALRHCDRVIANSDFTRKQLLDLGVRPEGIALICPGVDLLRFRPGLPCADLRSSIAIDAKEKLILSVGRLTRRKGFDQVIRAVAALVKSGLDVHYAVIGIGEDHDYLRVLAGQVGVSRRVHLLGEVSAEDLPRWFNACDVFAMPNRDIDGDTEGFGMVFIEAAACGKPSIAGAAGGTGAAVVDGETGHRVDSVRAENVERALANILDATGIAAAMGAKALARARSEFGWESVAERTRDLL